MNSLQEIREQCAARLLGSVERATRLKAFIGLDGFVDEIIHIVSQRQNAETYERLPTIASLAGRLAGAAGQSTNLEAVVQRIKLGGNGPIMANALARLGLKVTYLGALGYPTMHPVFNDFASRAEVHTIGEPGHTDALEFEDGKIMLGKTMQLNEVTWQNIQLRFGRKRFADKYTTSDLVGFVNWTMLPYMSDLWAALQAELCPAVKSPRRKIFFDLADPEKRTREDILRALQLIAGFGEYFDVLLGLNEKEAWAIGEVLGLHPGARTRDGLAALAREILRHVPIDTLVIHPVSFALAAGRDGVAIMDGPFIRQPLITTGAGDHFNAGFCLGKLLDFDNQLAVLTGVATSGYYVRHAQSPRISDLAEMLRAWPTKES